MDIFGTVCLFLSILLLFASVRKQKKAQKIYKESIAINKDSIERCERSSAHLQQVQGLYLELHAQAAIAEVQRGEL